MNDPEHKNQTLTIIPARPDKEVAEDLRKRMFAAFEPIMHLMDEAIQSGMVISWPPPLQFNSNTGHHFLPFIDISRHF